MLAFKELLNQFNFLLLSVLTLNHDKLNDVHNNDVQIKNVFYSPLSISTALGMVLAGSNGTTKNQIMSTMMSGMETGSNSSQLNLINQMFEEIIKNYSVSNQRILANKLFVDQEFNVKKSFENVIKNNFMAEISARSLSDQSIVTAINNWVDNNTNGLIKSIINAPFDDQTKLIILNAIYFKGKWVRTFDKKSTFERSFNNIDGTNSSVKMMSKRDDFKYLANNHHDYSMIELPYRSEMNGTSPSNASMVIVLPNQDNGILSILSNQSKMASVKEDIKNVGQRYPNEIKLQLPTFSLETEYDLKDKLSKIGIKDLFDSSKCDLSGIADGGIFVSDVMHKAKVIVNEEGSEAAAVTIIRGITASVRPRPREFIVDHSFLFFIKENDLILFSGVVYKL